MKKRCKKIVLYGSMCIMMNILFAACIGEVKETVLSNPSPTVTVTVTQAPVSTQATTPILTKELEPTQKLTPSPTEEPKQQVTPMLYVTITPTMTPTSTPTKAPTEAPKMTPTPVPTATVTPTVPPTIVPTVLPTTPPTVSLTASPTLLPSPTMVVTPTPAKDPLALIYAGWQQVIDPSGQYAIVFPDIYDKVSLEKESTFFKYVYTASAMSDIKWELCFFVEDTVELRQQKIIEQYPEMKVKLQTDGFVYYAETDKVFVAGEVYRWNYEATGMHGVMHIENSYPKEKKEEYQKEIYDWHVCVLKKE